jgi:alkylation response protein AidB-like acyl-CoA dehydrogenase
METPDLLAAARALAPTIRAHADGAEAERRLPAPLVEAFAAAGFFRMLVPRALGGPEASVRAFVETLEELGRADGSAGWCAMVASTTSLLAVYVDEDTARACFGDADAVACGVVAPMGTAVEVEGGYRASGRWAFASGCDHARWLLGGALVPRAGGPPEVRHLLFERAQVEVVDTWTVSGLRGSGSHDMVVRDALVPRARSCSLLADRPRSSHGPYAFPLFGLLSLGIAAVALGIARAAIETLTALATTKRPGGGRRTLAERELVQLRVAQAEAELRAARTFVLDAAGADGREPVLARLAACHAVPAAARAVDLMYEAGGGSSVYASSPLQRQFRDVHVATQHAMVSPATLAVLGRLLLGLPTDTTQV